MLGRLLAVLPASTLVLSARGAAVGFMSSCWSCVSSSCPQPSAPILTCCPPFFPARYAAKSAGTKLEALSRSLLSSYLERKKVALSKAVNLAMRPDGSNAGAPPQLREATDGMQQMVAVLTAVHAEVAPHAASCSAAVLPGVRAGRLTADPPH